MQYSQLEVIQDNLFDKYGFQDTAYHKLVFIRGCLWQPLILFSFADYVVRLHVMERYIQYKLQYTKVI